MGFFNDYPYTDFHEMNLDWILRQIRELHKDWDEFTAVNTITNAGAWDITKQYQAWTIVSDNNAGYISLKPVPAGVAITNTEYWGFIADYDILISDLSDRISALETDVAKIKADGMIFLGDSYGVDATAGGKSWASYVADVYPDAHYNMKGGTGFASDLYISDNFLTMLQAFPIGNKDAIKSIFIFGGANDANLVNNGTATLQDVKDRIAALAAWTKTNYKNAKVYVGFIGWYKSSTKFKDYLDTIEAYRAGCAVCDNAVYISGLEGIMRNDDYINSVDLVHPTADASATLGEFILTAVKTESNVSYYKVFDPVVTPSAEVNSVAGVSPSKQVTYKDTFVDIKVFGTFNANTSIDVRFDARSFAFGDSITICRLSNTPRCGGNPLSVAIRPLLIAPGGVINEIPAHLLLYGDSVVVVCENVNTLSGVVQLLIPSPLNLQGFPV